MGGARPSVNLLYPEPPAGARVPASTFERLELSRDSCRIEAAFAAPGAAPPPGFEALQVPLEPLSTVP